MIERYTRPQMSRVWSEENKLDKWFQVEVAACQAWAELGHIPRDAIEKIHHARYDREAMARYEAADTPRLQRLPPLRSR